MSSIEERLTQKQKADFAIFQAAGENADAFEYLQMLSFCGRIVDDIFDQDVEISSNDLLSLVEILFVRLPANAFYQQHRDLLFSQHISMWNAWDISNVLEKGNETDKIYAHVLRDYINEILPIVALLTQGHNKMKEINSLTRSLFQKQLGD